MNQNKNKQKIILSGGGTGGSVTPLLAIARELFKNQESDLLFIGSENGPESELIYEFQKEFPELRFKTFLSGKLRRYFSWSNFTDLFKIVLAFFKYFSLLREEKPDLIISAGSFVSVPLVWAAAIKNIPILIHQQDIRPGLANKLMAPFAKIITVSFEKSLSDYGAKAVWTGNPAVVLNTKNNEIVSNEFRKKYKLENHLPFVLIVGGGTGARAINELTVNSLEALTEFCEVVHVTGKGKLLENNFHNSLYHSFDFLPHQDLLNLMSMAELVVSRAGLGFLTELSVLEKASIIIPIPNSHQEDNAVIFKSAQAAVVLDQLSLSSIRFTAEIKNVLFNKELKFNLKKEIGKIMKQGAAQEICQIIKSLGK